ncbi:serine hydrolase [Robiginitalea sp. M366]|uniref:serine hydrolase domain-containing protein n=1 Tax=Robiginitalea aestuariiviva TaxID=3036903 RepID=UPI00240E8E57|nr:serine hydrolase domain-containing protein [Robiginitalea aestuariiviva]MDG1573447.1 serine hydrolase [Robiginitalea aestuariiviva]
MKPYYLCLSLILLAVSCQEKPAPEPNRVVQQEARARMDSLLQSLVASGKVAGVSSLVYEKGQEAYFGAYGYANREDSIPMARNTLVQIFSMTKPLTGTALMSVYETGAFALDDSLAQYAPEFAGMQVYKGVDEHGQMQTEPARSAITIRDITRHTAGFPNRTEIPGLGDALAEAAPLAKEKTLSEMAATFGKLPLWFHPGTQWEYGPSVDVQAFLVERLSGMPFDDYLQQEVLGPLGMTDTRRVVPPADRERFSAMYRLEEDGSLTQIPDSLSKIEHFQAWPLQRGGWGMTSSLDDYMRFARMLLGRGTLNGVQVLKPETVALMATNHLPDSVTERAWLPSKGQVGFGIDFAVRTAPPAGPQENNGAVGEFFWDGAASTLFWVDPQNELAAVLFVQLFPYDPIRLHKNFRDAVYGPYVPPATQNAE